MAAYWPRCNAADNHRLVRIALLETDHHLMPDARPEETPQPFPAHTWATRSQQELSPLFFPSRSQWNCTFTRPYLSQ